MAWNDATLAQPYAGLYYSYPEEDARLDADVSNRARQFSAQSAASRGSRSSRGPALNTYNRLTSDYTLGKAQQDRSNRLAYTNTMNALMRSPGAVSPSDKSVWAGAGGEIGKALLKEAAPGIVKGIKKPVEDWWNASPSDLSNQYNALSSGSLYAGGSLGPNMSGELAASGQGYGMLPQGADAYASLPSWTPDFDNTSYALENIPWTPAFEASSYAAENIPWDTPDFSEAYNAMSSLW
jgi:hypothetical protein